MRPVLFSLLFAVSLHPAVARPVRAQADTYMRAQTDDCYATGRLLQIQCAGWATGNGFAPFVNWWVGPSNYLRYLTPDHTMTLEKRPDVCSVVFSWGWRCDFEDSSLPYPRAFVGYRQNVDLGPMWQAFGPGSYIVHLTAQRPNPNGGEGTYQNSPYARTFTINPDQSVTITGWCRFAGSQCVVQ